MSDNCWWSIALTICVVLALLIGIAIGAKIGSNSIAEKWCAAEGYGEGRYGYPNPTKRIQEGGKRVVCSHANPIVVQGE